MWVQPQNLGSATSLRKSNFYIKKKEETFQQEKQITFHGKNETKNCLEIIRTDFDRTETEKKRFSLDDDLSFFFSLDFLVTMTEVL